MKNMHMRYIRIVAVAGALTMGWSLHAKENLGEKAPTKSDQTDTKELMKFAADCEPASAQADLDINNVRTRILNGGDMWWDLNNARYEIPKVTDLNAVRKNSLFAGALWIGGEDQGVLKLAAMTYRQSGSDFWPGPLDRFTGATNGTRCQSYDEIYKINRTDIEKHRELFEANGFVLRGESADAIWNWPGNGLGPNEPEIIAPFYDEDGDGIYEPENGDFPVLQSECRGSEIANEDNTPEDQPDQMLFFVYNDRGNIHTETQAQAIGLELRTTAFAYATNDEINNMTFYTTEVINRGVTELQNTYFGQWVDPDLGNYSDDYVGCDVELSLGFCYNGDDNDEGILGYGLNPPSIGVDFFEGPKRDTIIDGELVREELGMSKFVYYDNDFTDFGNPTTPIHYYNYLRGIWKNGDCMTKDGANGRTGSECTDYLFPGTSTGDDNWTEKTAGNTPADRRFLQTSGPFTLQPGAVNKVTVGVVWAKASSGGATGSLDLLKASSRKAQELFDNCFDILDGPDAPTVETQELDKELIVMFQDTDSIETHVETTVTDGVESVYRFQGYRLYQLKNSTVGTGDLDDIDLAREIFTCDLEDSITRLVNKPFDEVLGQPLPKLMIDGPNEGLVHSISITEDAFATTATRELVNHKPYYYMLISYAALPGHPTVEYLAGRRIQQFSLIPHKPEPREGGLKLNGKYGDSPRLIRLSGTGNGGRELELTEESKKTILSQNFMANPEYEIGKGPVNIKIVDPIKVPQGNFELTLLESDIPGNINSRRDGLNPANTRWVLENTTTGEQIFSDTTINFPKEQLIVNVDNGSSEIINWGLSVKVEQVVHPGTEEDQTNGFISWDVEWEDNSQQWLTAIPDFDGPSWFNWIRSGRVGNTSTKDYSEHDYYYNVGTSPNVRTVPLDQFEIYENIWDGRIAPYRLASRDIQSQTPAPALTRNVTHGVAFDGPRIINDWHNLSNLSSVDIVITRDESLWTQCLVLEMGMEPTLNQGGSQKFGLRQHPSINLDGSENAAEQSRSWFPGYAINVETGQRLNIIIGEDSYQGANNGRDLKWNPTDDAGFYTSGYPAFGGRHYIYIMGAYDDQKSGLYPEGPIYDGGKQYLDYLTDANTATYARELNNKVLYQAMWAIPAYMARGFKMDVNENGMPVPPTEVTFKLRVSKPYQYFDKIPDVNDLNPKYSFSTDGVFAEESLEHGKSALDLIRAVPNPYYAYSGYENNPVENTIKLTNLPPECTISIFTLDGQLVRKVVKDDENTEFIWDLKNNARVPIASGTYLIHINAGDRGEKVVKWMGFMRMLDLDSF
jgi:hypothetical protein